MFRTLPCLTIASICSLLLSGCAAETDTESPCDDIPRQWDELVSAHNTCEVDNDCTIVVGRERGDCECSPYIGEPEGTVINRSGYEQATRLKQRFFSDACQGDIVSGICDGGALTDAFCEDRHCQADTRGCMVDAGY